VPLLCYSLREEELETKQIAKQMFSSQLADKTKSTFGFIDQRTHSTYITETQRQRHREREGDRQTDRQTDRERETARQRLTVRETYFTYLLY